MKERNLSFDVFRLVGLFLIMLAHSSPPEWLFQLRNFDVPLLILASGVTYAYLYGGRIDAVSFYKRRIPKLLIPAWTFLTLFFVLLYIASSLFSLSFPFSISEVYRSYIFRGGIGFVWVFPRFST